MFEDKISLLPFVQDYFKDATNLNTLQQLQYGYIGSLQQR